MRVEKAGLVAMLLEVGEENAAVLLARSTLPDELDTEHDLEALLAFGLERDQLDEVARLVIGGIEASLRRFAHYDYWDDDVRRSLLLDSRADILVYGPGEIQAVEIARRQERSADLLGVPGTCVVRKEKLLRAIAGWDEELTPNAVEVYVSRLRGKLGDAVAIRTVRGLGYLLAPPAEAP